MTNQILDCSDLDRVMGKPMTTWCLRDDLHNNDFRRWAQAMHYPNLLHYDDDFAARGRYGRLVAPQSFAVAAGEGHGACPAGIGMIPDSHLIFGGDEWWFSGTRLFSGDKVIHEKVPFDYVVKETKFAGPTCFQRGDNNYYRQDGSFVAKQRSTAIRYRPDLAVEMQSMTETEDPVWTDAELADIEKRKLEFVDAMHALGHDRRWWDDAKEGDALPVRVFGPHSIASFATEWRAYLMNLWGSAHRNEDCDPKKLGYLGPMADWEMDPHLEKINPEATDGAYIGASRGHLFKRYAQFVGMPREYGYGASMGAWILDYLAGWAGEWGLVVHVNSQYRGPAFTGDITIMTGNITGKEVDAEGRNIVRVECKMANQNGTTMATAKGEIELPKK